jgi:hypothetical protein
LKTKRKPKIKDFKDGGKVTGGKARFRMDRPIRRREDGGKVGGPSASDVAAAIARQNARPMTINSDEIPD